MEFLNLARLKRTLARGPLEPAEAAKYVAAQSMFFSLIFVPTPSNEEPEAWTFILTVLLAGLGVFYCYRSNGGSLGERFVERYLAVGWVVGWRVGLTAAIFSLLFVGGWAVAAPESFGAWSENHSDSDAWVAAGYAVIAFVYWRTGVHLRDVQRGVTGAPTSTAA